MSFSVTLIITTYNWPEALNFCLESVKRQTVKPAEVIVVDDGSGFDTRHLIASHVSAFASLGMDLNHCWQADKGFRAAKARNLGLGIASGDYVIMTDQDIILDPHFVEDHVNHAKHGRMITGRRMRLTEAYTRELLGEPNNPDLLPRPYRKGVPLDRSFGCLRIGWLQRLFSKATYDYNGVLSCNMSFWREDALFINGFNTDFTGWGCEDYEFYCRMRNAYGMERYHLKHAAVAYHLYHHESSKAQLASNQAILQRTIEDVVCVCRNGLNRRKEMFRVASVDLEIPKEKTI